MQSTHTLDPRFANVADTFERIVANDPVGGSAVAAFVDGECVLNLWGGEARPGRSWNADTLTTIFSCTKGLTAITVAILVERGVLDSATPVAHYWPAFASVSSALTVRELLEHKSGLSAVRHDMALADVIDHDTLIATLLEQGPLWEPGTGYAYHSLTFGTVVDELVRQATGRPVADWFRELVAEPLDIDAWIGLPAALEPRMSQLVPAGSFALPDDPALHPHEMEQRAGSFGTAFPVPESFEPDRGFNSAAVREVALPGVNGSAGAYALAKIWSAVVTPTDGVRLLSDDMVRFMAETRITGAPVWGGDGPFWDRGFGVMLETPALRPALGPGSFGHDGLGGQIGWASPSRGASIGYVSNALHPGATQLDRWGELCAAFLASLEEAQR
ncbi:MAG TPA: serine hydrolase domain-containing protein [Microbacteriaceae bacterium]|nr:serine hydrolase domain-containing protein [Microbacteriaceae bacterium]